MGSLQLTNRSQYIRIVISDDNDIVAVVRNTGGNRSSLKSEIENSPDAHLSGGMMALKHGNLVYLSVRSKKPGLRIRRQPDVRTLRKNLPGDHADRGELFSVRPQFQFFRIDGADMNGIHQLWRTGRHFYVFPCNQLSLEKYHLRIEILQRIPNHQIRVKAGCDCPGTAQPVAAGRLDGRHLHRGNRADSHADCLPDIVIDVALPVDILDVLVIRTETEPLGVRIILHDSPDDHFQIAGGAALPDVAGHPHRTFLHHILVGCPLMIRGNAGHHISCQFFIGQIRSMPVFHLSIKQFNFFIHGGIAVDDRHAVHHLAQPEHTVVVQIFLHGCRIQRTSVIIDRCRRHAGSDHDIHMCREIGCLRQQIIDSCRSGYIGNLMGIHDERGGSVFLRLGNQNLRVYQR